MRQQILALGRDSLIYGVGSILTRFIGLLTLPLFARYLTPEEYGVLAMLAVLSMVAQPVFSLGLAAAMGPHYFAERDGQTKQEVIWTTFFLNLGSAAGMVILGWMFPEVLAEAIRLKPDNADLVRLSLCGCGLAILATAHTQRIQLEKQARLYVAITFLSAFSTTVFSWVTVVHWGWGARGMIWGQLLGGAVAFAAFFAVGLNAGRPQFKVVLAGKLLRVGVPLIPSFAFLFIIANVNKYILEWVDGLDQVGIYSIGYNFGTTISIFTNGLMTAWYPFFIAYIDRQDEAKTIFSKIFTYYCIGVGVIVVAFFVMAKPVLGLLLPQAYWAAAGVVGCVAAGHYFVGVFNLLLPAAHFKRDFSAITLSQFYASLLALVLCLFLIHLWGLWGAGLSFMAGHALMALTLHLSNLKYRPDGLSVTYETKKLLAFASLSVLWVLLYQGSETWRAGVFSLGHEFIFSAFSLLVFVYMVYRSNLDTEERHWIQDRLRLLLGLKV